MNSASTSATQQYGPSFDKSAGLTDLEMALELFQEYLYDFSVGQTNRLLGDEIAGNSNSPSAAQQNQQTANLISASQAEQVSEMVDMIETELDEINDNAQSTLDSSNDDNGQGPTQTMTISSTAEFLASELRAILAWLN